MSTQIQRRRGTTTEHGSFTGALAELTVDTTKKTVVVHDGTTVGGTPLAKENLSNVPAGSVTSAMILDGTIVNADINASAAIAGTKISPDFGSQNTTTTGTSTAASFIPSSSTAPTNGLYLPAANSVALATGGSGRLFIDSSGRVGIGESLLTRNLTIKNSSSIVAASLVSNSANIAYLLFGDTDADAQGRVQYDNSADALQLYSNGSERLRLTSTGTLNFVGAGTAGSTQAVSFNGSAPVNSLVIDSSGRLGIGTSSPGSNLYVAASGAGGKGGEIIISNQSARQTGNYAQLGFAPNSDYTGSTICGFIRGIDTAGGVGNPAALAFGVGSAGSPSERMRIDELGRVGIGTSSPSYSLDVVGVVRSQGSTSGGGIVDVAYTGTTTGNQLGAYRFYGTGAGVTAETQIRSSLDSGSLTSSYLTFSTSSSGSLAERVRIDSSGRVGIGTTTVNTTLEVQNASTPIIRVGDGTRHMELRGGSSGQNAAIGTNYAGGFDIIQNGNAAITIDSSKRVLVGTSTGQCQLTVWDTSLSAGTVRFFKNVASSQSYPALVLDKLDNTNTTSQVFLQFTINNQSTAAGQINANGASQAAFGTYSDRRLKENIVDLNSQWQLFKALRPVEFDYIASEGGGHQIGFIAQEVQELFPDVVSERLDGMLTLSGMGKNEARHIKALQEAMERIEQLEAKVAALEAN